MEQEFPRQKSPKQRLVNGLMLWNITISATITLLAFYTPALLGTSRYWPDFLDHAMRYADEIPAQKLHSYVMFSDLLLIAIIVQIFLSLTYLHRKRKSITNLDIVEGYIKHTNRAMRSPFAVFIASTIAALCLMPTVLLLLMHTLPGVLESPDPTRCTLFMCVHPVGALAAGWVIPTISSAAASILYLHSLLFIRKRGHLSSFFRDITKDGA